MKLNSTSFDNVYLIEEPVHTDERGFFMETWSEMGYSNKKLLNDIPSLKAIQNDNSLFSTLFVQDNLSSSKKGVFRGLHYQTGNFAQSKLVRVLKGSVIDFIVDLREDSKTYGKFEFFELNDKNNLSLFVPPYFAHGFLSLEDDTIFTYKCGNYYHKESEGSVNYSDPIIRHVINNKESILDVIKIYLPYESEEDILISKKDKDAPKFLHRRHD
jgi:dTDP-4-dehydrorhamnose 3,5-epimerase|tara:strand:- start:12287 stop:12928 length:642 start_codon:yes stop_codon:yes gene_type:complete